MKNKYLAIFMALILCFSLAFGATAAVEGTQVTQQEQVVPTTSKDIADKVGDVVGGIAGDDLSQAGEEIMDGIYEGQGILRWFYNIIENIKIMLANFVNTFLGFTEKDSIFG